MSTLSLVCPKCYGELHPEDIENWAQYGTVPTICDKCGMIFWVTVSSESYEIKQEDDLLTQIHTKDHNSSPNLPIGTSVQVVFKEHALYGKVGRIVERRYGHYRIAIENRVILLPINGVRKV